MKTVAIVMVIALWLFISLLIIGLSPAGDDYSHVDNMPKETVVHYGG